MKDKISFQRVFGGLVIATIFSVYSLFSESKEFDLSLNNLAEVFWLSIKQLGLQAISIGVFLEVYNLKSKNTPPKFLFIFIGVVLWSLVMLISQQLFFPVEGTIKESLLGGAFIGLIISWSHYSMIQQEKNAI